MSVGRPWVAQRVWADTEDCRRGAVKRLQQVGQLADTLLDEHVAAARDERDASRVVAAVLEPAQALEQDGRRFTRADVADDSAHVSCPCPVRESIYVLAVDPERTLV